MQYNQVHIIDDEDFYLDDAKFNLKKINFSGKSFFYKTVESFIKSINEINGPAVLVVDYDLGHQTALESDIISVIKGSNVKKIVLVSVIDLKSKNTVGFDLVAEKQRLDWKKILMF